MRTCKITDQTGTVQRGYNLSGNIHVEVRTITNGCASEIGEWCVYAEKEEDVAVIAIKNSDRLEEFMPSIKKLWGIPIREILKDKKSYSIPFSILVPDWEKVLMKNYG